MLTPDLVRTGAYQVNVGGRLYPATVHLRPPFDPAGDRVKGRYPPDPSRQTAAARPSLPSPPRRPAAAPSRRADLVDGPPCQFFQVQRSIDP